MQALNIALFQAIAAGPTPDSQALLWFAASVAEGTTWVCLALMGWVAWRQPAQRSYAMAALVAAAAASFIAQELAEVIGMPRPFVVGLSPAHIEHGIRGALPSAHATVMFTVGLVYCLRAATRKLGLAILAIAVLTGWARIYVGVHFPFDILAGLGLAIAMTGLFWLLKQLGQRLVAPLIARDDLRAH
ncbi:phosphatase PAP2 family protein [Variovorax sp. KK3]|uniref:phosphatase PAP2 family protein n=1 Tax=Variovorax sp. KK3 TaxID=1855728 RepID=UPI00097C029C|nr:phosphatase PAP2 family protein [Variovorax sp. KK3]